MCRGHLVSCCREVRSNLVIDCVDMRILVGLNIFGDRGRFYFGHRTLPVSYQAESEDGYSSLRCYTSRDDVDRGESADDNIRDGRRIQGEYPNPKQATDVKDAYDQIQHRALLWRLGLKPISSSSISRNRLPSN